MAAAMDEIIEARIERVVSGGAGLARSGGRAVFAPLTAPGDLARLRIVAEKPGWTAAELVELIEPSPQRADPVCPLFGVCGGCNFQHLAYQAQLEAKEAIVIEDFSRIAGRICGQKDENQTITVHSSPPLGSRNRVQLHCSPENRRLLGFRPRTGGRNGGDLVVISDCPVAEKGIRRGILEKTLVPPPQKDRFTVYSQDGNVYTEGGARRGRVKILGKDLFMDAALFFQSNAVMLEALLLDLQALAARAGKTLPMGDFYCGVGTFAAFLAPLFPGAVLLEKNRQALALARQNLPGGLKADFHGLDDDRFAASPAAKVPLGFAVVDPPRGGLSPLMRKHLAASGPPLLAYVSCAPETLARDAAALIASGYALTSLDLYDFYPQTTHIETLAVFEK